MTSFMAGLNSGNKENNFLQFIPAFPGPSWLGLCKHGWIQVLQIFPFGAEQSHSSLFQSSGDNKSA